MNLKLTYYKRSGKWYTESGYQSKSENHWEIVGEIRDLKFDGELPGLVKGAKEFHILIQFLDGTGLSHLELL